MDAKVSEWYKARLERQHQLQSESLSSFINSGLDTPLHVHAVSVRGAVKTRSSFLESIVNSAEDDVTKPSSTLEDVLHTARIIGDRLQETGVFSSVQANLEPSSQVGDKEAVNIVFNTRERSRFFLKTSTELGDNEGTASLQGTFTNIFGGAESLNVNLATGTATRRNAQVLFRAPLTSDVKTWGELSGFIRDVDKTIFASCMENLGGVQAALKRGSIATGMSQFAYSYTARHLHSLTPTASFSIRNSTASNIKASFTHTFTYDSRDDPITPSRGLKVQADQELSLPTLGSSTSFFKSELQTYLGRSLSSIGFPSTFVSTSLRAGVLHSLNPDRSTQFSDRFQVGGPTSVRLFKIGGMGIHDGADSVGSTMYYSFGLSLFTPLPIPSRNWSNDTSASATVSESNSEESISTKNWSISTDHTYPVLLQWWVNGGRAVGGPVDMALNRIQNHGPSLSAGVGILYRFTPLRLELNFGVPLAMSKGEQFRKGLQVGVGVDFL